MEVEVDIDWVTNGMRLVVDSLVTLSDRQWNMKLSGFEVILRGRMLFVLKLSRSRLPGIVGEASPELLCVHGTLPCVSGRVRNCICRTLP